MKAVLFLIAGAAAIAPPRIELDLSSTAVKNADLASHIKTNLLTGIAGVSDATTDLNGGTDATLMKTHEYASTSPYTKTANSKHITSRQDWSQQCPAKTATLLTCPFPTPKAFDHNDREVDVKTNVFLIDLDGADSLDGNSLPAVIDENDIFTEGSKLYGKRATYLFKYDAVDEAGNRAEQVVFALILNDQTKPNINPCYAENSIAVEAATQANGKYEFFCEKDAVQTLPLEPGSADDASSFTAGATAGVKPAAIDDKYTATDNIDTIASSAIHFNIYSLTALASSDLKDKTPDSQKLTLEEARAALGTKLTSVGSKRSIVEAVVSDNANFYGLEGESNEQTAELDVTIADTTGPALFLNGLEKVNGECCRPGATNCATQAHHGYVDRLATANDANDGQDVTISSTGTHTVLAADGTTIELKSDGQLDDNNVLSVDLSSVAEKYIFFVAKDKHGNQAQYLNATTQQSQPFARRHVSVVDRNVPEIKLVGGDVTIRSSKALGSDHEAVLCSKYETGCTHGEKSLDEGVTVSDSCVADINSKITVEWLKNENEETATGPGDFSDLGSWTRKYTVCDRNIGGYFASDGKSPATDECDGKNKWEDQPHCCATASENGDQLVAVPCCASVSRVFEVVDKEAPTIKVMGEPNMVGDKAKEADREIEYTDAGAMCNDYVDGVLSHAVEVSGEVVNMRKPGTYKIRYDCIDLSGLSAEPKFRTVEVKDTTCPQIKLEGAETNYVEAGFPYKDAGFTATDNLDQVISGIGPFSDGKAGCKTDGNTVNVAQAFYARHSCKDIKDNCGDDNHGACQTGEYYISVVDEDSGVNERVLVWCNMESGKTYFAVDGQGKDGQAVIPAVPGALGGENDCTKYGLEMASYATTEERETAFEKFCGDAATDACKFFPVDNSMKSSSYLCSLNDEASASTDKTAVSPHLHSTNGAEVGVYKIQFTCKDSSGNKDCDWKAGKIVTRTVKVQDTLPPVITLRFKNQLVAAGKHDQVGLNNIQNPAGTAAGNPHILDGDTLMAEEATTNVNGWIVGAVASAVSGLALLGYSLRKSSDVVTSVPV